jgi:hypothetical protein
VFTLKMQGFNDCYREGAPVINFVHHRWENIALYTLFGI